MTVDNITMSGVVRTEKKTVTLQMYGFDGSGDLHTEKKDITIYYLSAGSTIDEITPVLTELTYFNMAEDGTYSKYDSDQMLPSFTVDESFEMDLYLLSSMDTGEEFMYFALDKGQAPAASETPAEPAVPTEPETPAAPAEPTAPAAPAPVGSYTVKKGDTYGKIALNNYGTYDVWQQLYKANKYAKLTEGAKLVLPETLGKTAKIAAPSAAEGETLYTVKAGDTLGAIAKTVYGDVMKYKAVFERNADRLVNANIIYEGQVIVLPAK